MEHKSEPSPEGADDAENTPEQRFSGGDEPTEPEDGPYDEQPPPRSRGRAVPTWMAVVLVVLALGAGYLLGRPSYPLDTSADAGFLRDMSTHHDQAVVMSMLILDKTEEPELDTVAKDIARTQQSQIGIMQGWLTVWGLNSRGAEPPMTWMAGSEHDHGGDDGVPEAMPGLATAEEMAALEAAEGVDAEILFLELMIAHHEGGIDMAEAEAELGGEELVMDFAEGMAAAQRAEIDLMDSMLEQRGAGDSGD